MFKDTKSVDFIQATSLSFIFSVCAVSGHKNGHHVNTAVDVAMGYIIYGKIPLYLLTMKFKDKHSCK